MKKIKYILVVSFCFFLLLECQNDTFDISEYAELMDNPSDIFEKIDFVQLETNDSTLIGNIGKIQLADSFIYLLDKTQDCIFIFNDDGSFNNKISRKGKGPGEYLAISDFEADDNGNIEILAYRQLLLYDKNLDFKKSFDLPEVSHFFSRINKDNIALYHLQAEKRLSIFNTETKSVIYSDIKSFENSRLLPVNPYKSPFYRFDDEVYVKHTFTNDLLKISHNNIEDYTTIFPSYNVDFSKMPKNKNKAFYIRYFLEKTSPFVVEAFHNEKIFQAYCTVKGKGFYYIKCNNSNSYYFDRFKDSIKYAVNYCNDIITYGYLEIEEAYNYLNNSDLNNLIPNRTIENMNFNNINDNPVLVKYYLR